MKPEKVEELIQNHLDMSLSSEQKAQLENYLDTHAEARVDLDRYKKILAILDAEKEIDPPTSFTQTVMDKLPEVQFRKTGQGGYGSIFENLGSVVGVVGLALAAVFVFAVMKMESPFFRVDDGYRPQSQTIDVANGVKNIPTSNLRGQTIDRRHGNHSALDLSVKMSIHAIDGQVFLGTNPKKLKLVTEGSSEILKAGHIIRTIGNARISYADDHTEIKLKPKTELRVVDHENFHLKHGDVWVEIRKKVDHFEVKTDHLVAAVRGTQFAVIADTINWNTVTTSRVAVPKASSQVHVFEGEVEVRNLRSGSFSKSVEVGEGIIFSESTSKIESRDLTQKDYENWGEIMPNENSSDSIILNNETGPSGSFDQEVE
tara:strand:+ start:840 stop:1958 length:1119 start_codon:yes stop_codon:yes gene_type:complete